MIRYLFSLLLVVHGLIHVLGFAKAFHLGSVSGLAATISKPLGVLWLVAALLFLATAFLFLLQKENWWLLAALALLLSQGLIIADWHDAKAGTLANVIVIIAAILAFANWNFTTSFQHQVQHMLAQSPEKQTEVVTKEMLQTLPPPVQRWLLHSGIVGKEKIHSVHLHQKGFMRLKPEQDKWIPTVAEQYFTIDQPAFLWRVKMQLMPLVPVTGSDQFVAGKGQMLIKAFSLLNLVNEADEKIDQGALQRYLAEICWFPSAALSPYIKWEAIDESSAKATMQYKGVAGAVVFYFNQQGDMTHCAADRYKGGGKEATLEKWVVSSRDYAEMKGIRMPVKSEATWRLKNGDFTWYKLEITHISYNQPFSF